MKYCSTYLWEKGVKQIYHPVSLVLQQVEVRKQAVLFACVCRGAVEGDAISNTSDKAEGFSMEGSGYFTESLVEWFHREGLKMVERKGSKEEMERVLQEELVAIQKAAIKYMEKKECKIRLEFAGILLVEEQFVLFSKGQIYMYLLNRRFNRKHMRCIAGGEEMFGIESGVLQKRLGLLLCTKEFLEGRESDELVEVLMTDGDISEERMQKRLKELWTESDSVGAVFLRIY